jgi:hypothetical protein
MALPHLNDKQLERIREFFTSDDATLLWQRLEAQIMADWLVAPTPAEREKHWYEIQAVLQLQATLRDATAMKRLDQRSQNVSRTPTV